MKKTIITLMALAGVASAASTVVTFGGLGADYTFVTDAYTISGVGSASGTLSDDTEFTLAATAGSFWGGSTSGSIAGSWINTDALKDLNTTLGVSYTAADLSEKSKMYYTAPGAGDAGSSLTLNFSNANVGNTITLYAMVTAHAGDLTSFTVSGLDNQTIGYATNSGSGFSDTGAFSEGAGAITMVKITGEITSANLVLTPAAGKKSGFQSVAYQIIPEPTTATLSLLALAGLAARRRRK